MVNFCCVVGCSHRSNREERYSFYSIPAIIDTKGKQMKETTKARRQKWIASIKRDGWQPAKSSRVCSAHFISGLIYYTPLKTFLGNILKNDLRKCPARKPLNMLKEIIFPKPARSRTLVRHVQVH